MHQNKPRKSINLISLDLWAPAVGQIQFLTVVQQCNVRMLINWRSDWYILDWSGAKRHCCQRIEKTCCCPYSLTGRHFILLLWIVAEIDKINELLAKVTKMLTKTCFVSYFD